MDCRKEIKRLESIIEYRRGLIEYGWAKSKDHASIIMSSIYRLENKIKELKQGEKPMKLWEAFKALSENRELVFKAEKLRKKYPLVDHESQLINILADRSELDYPGNINEIEFELKPETKELTWQEIEVAIEKSFECYSITDRNGMARASTSMKFNQDKFKQKLGFK